MKPVPRPKLPYGNTSKSFTTASGAIRALAMWRLLCLHRISAKHSRPLETGVSTIARTPHTAQVAMVISELLQGLNVMHGVLTGWATHCHTSTMYHQKQQYVD